MTPIFNICKTTTCGIVITDLTKPSGNYVPETETTSVVNQFKYSQTVTIDMIQLIKINENEIIKSIITSHSTDVPEISVPFNKDGLFKVTHIILPTTAWLESELQNTENILDLYSTIYVSDGLKVYKYINGSLVECPILELVERNIEGTTISSTEKSTFSICYLSKCFVTLCNEILNKNLTKCKSKNSDLEDLIFKRDFVWMTINVIKYLIDLGQLLEAQRILEESSACNGICYSTMNSLVTGRSSGCGCV